MIEDFLTGDELSAEQLTALLELAEKLRVERRQDSHRPLTGKSVALLFEKHSTRTRISFEIGIFELGGHAVVLRENELQLSRGESIRDTALVLSRYVNAIVVRTGPHELVEQMAEHATVPVINALTQLHHPCQALADLQTLKQRFGTLAGLKLTYVGDGNNVTNSLLIAAAKIGVEVTVATPPGYEPNQEIFAAVNGKGKATLTDDPAQAVANADAIYTDVWVSMGDEAEAVQRKHDLAPFQINADLLAKASQSAVVMHCLPAHPGEEITEDLLYGQRSAIWDQAENRLHTQKALLQTLLWSDL